MQNQVFALSHKQITLTIDGREYLAIVFFCLNDAIELENYNNDETTPRQRISNLIRGKIKTNGGKLPSAEIIAAQSDSLFQTYIDALLEADDKLKASYDKFSEETEICNRLFFAVQDEWNELAANAIPKISVALESANRIIEAAKSSFDSSSLRDILDNYQQISAQITETLAVFVNQFAELIGNIHIPSISEARKEELRQTYEKWGRYGWTTIPKADFTLFDNCPDTLTEANETVLAFCKAKEMEQLFSDLKKMKGVNKSDVDAAIVCFENKQYKPCAMLLFSLIDAKLIRLQRKEDYIIKKDKSSYRASGKTAAKKLEKHIKEEQNIENRLFMLLAYTNLFACLKTVFADGNDFRKQPAVINRHFVDHGMWTKAIVRIDCVQLFLLYFNLLKLLNIITRVCMVTIKPIEEHEFQNIVDWNKDQSEEYLFQWAGYKAYRFPMTVEQIKIRNSEKGSIIFAIYDDEKMIGSIELEKNDHCIGSANVCRFILSDESKNKGYGFGALNQLIDLAFSDLNLNQLTLRVFCYNIGAIRCYEKCGFLVKEYHQNENPNRDSYTMELNKNNRF